MEWNPSWNSLKHLCRTVSDSHWKLTLISKIYGFILYFQIIILRSTNFFGQFFTGKTMAGQSVSSLHFVIVSILKSLRKQVWMVI